MKYNTLFILCLSLFIHSCKTDVKSDEKAVNSTAGIPIPTEPAKPSPDAFDPTKPTGALPELGKEFCFSLGNSTLKITEQNSTLLGSYTGFENSKKTIDGKFLGVFKNDTIKGMVLSSVNNVNKPIEVWFVKDGENYVTIKGKSIKDDKGGYRFDPKSISSGETLIKGNCK
jgi:hypothetical protein